MFWSDRISWLLHIRDHINNRTVSCLLQNYNAKISDFGLAKLGPSGEQSHVTTRVMGTYGYAAPEYMATGNFILLIIIHKLSNFVHELDIQSFIVQKDSSS